MQEPQVLIESDSKGQPLHLWTVGDVAEYFRISERTLREWRELDPTFPMPLDLPGRTLRWHPDDVVEWALSLRELELR